MDKIKQVIVMRKDLNMRKGKMCAQAAHASMKFIIESLAGRETEVFIDELFNDEEFHWFFNGKFTKIVLGVDSEAELMDYYIKANDVGLQVHMIVDEGLTEFNNIQTLTCFAIGPDYSSKIDAITGKLKPI